jgi:hypothetical protein
MVAVAAAPALRAVSRQTGVALAAGGDRADDDAIAYGVAGHPLAERLNDAYRLVSDDQPLTNRVLAL